jgi:hypothetical protein
LIDGAAPKALNSPRLSTMVAVGPPLPVKISTRRPDCIADEPDPFSQSSTNPAVAQENSFSYGGGFREEDDLG